MEPTIKDLLLKKLEQEESCVIQLEMGAYDYSLSEIARIVEENDAKILGLTVDDNPEDPGRIVVTLLLNQL